MEPTAVQAHVHVQDLLTTYKPSSATIALVQRAPLLFLVGISGAGKDTVIQELVKTGKYHLLVSYTTRQPRMNNGEMEQDGIAYHFVTWERAERMLGEGAFVEANLYGGNVYGTAAAEIEVAAAKGKIAVTDIEVQGVAVYDALKANMRPIFLLPPSYAVWQERLRRRYGDAVDPQDLAKRLQTALSELRHALEVPYFYFVVNDQLAETVHKVAAIASGAPQATEEVAVGRRIAESICKQLQATI